MPAPHRKTETPTPLQFLLAQPATPEEGLIRASMVMGRLLGYGWENQKVFENYISMAQTGTVAACEDMWRNTLEALYLKEPKRAEKIEIS